MTFYKQPFGGHLSCRTGPTWHTRRCHEHWDTTTNWTFFEKSQGKDFYSGLPKQSVFYLFIFHFNPYIILHPLHFLPTLICLPMLSIRFIKSPDEIMNGQTDRLEHMESDTDEQICIKEEYWGTYWKWKSLNCVLLLLQLSTTATGAFQEKRPEQSSLTVKSTRVWCCFSAWFSALPHFYGSETNKSNKQNTNKKSTPMDWAVRTSLILFLKSCNRKLLLTLFCDYCPPASLSVRSSSDMLYPMEFGCLPREAGVLTCVCACVCDLNVFTVEWTVFID